MSVKFNGSYLKNFIREEEYVGVKEQITQAHNILHEKKGLGNDFLGWLDLPDNYDKDEFERIKKAAEKIKNDTQVLIVIGIGGSYLGARAAIELMTSANYNALKKETPEIYFVGNNLSSDYIHEVLELCEGKDISINVISKSGTTTEPAIAFRIFREYIENKYGKEEAKKRIYATTDRSKGTLKELSDREGYETFVVPDDVGGRFSVLTAVGLLPIAVAGLDLEKIMSGAKTAMDELAVNDIEKNDCYKYAATRNILYRKGKNVELLVSYNPSFAMMAEWFKQLFGESEGKDQKGIFPASVTFSTDLHSLGQFIQDGSRMMFETVVNIEKPKHEIVIKANEEDFDGLNFVADKEISYVAQKAFVGTVLAHTDGGTPNIVLDIPKIDEFEFGYMVYFFEKACAISGYMLGVNPFDQPGVEQYKKNMFALLGKKGYEAQRAELEDKLKLS